MRLLLFSDLHADASAARRLVSLSMSADVIVGAGDFGNVRRQLNVCIDVLSEIDRPAILIPGNNESLEELNQACRQWPTAHVLHGNSITVAGVEFFGLGGGVPITPFGPWSVDFSEEQAARMLAGCPDGCVLVSHSPPKGVLDESSDRHEPGEHGSSRRRARETSRARCLRAHPRQRGSASDTRLIAGGERRAARNRVAVERRAVIQERLINLLAAVDKSASGFAHQTGAYGHGAKLMELFYDDRDDKSHEARGSQILYWLDDLGARPVSEARTSDEGFLFAGARSTDDYRNLVSPLLRLRDRPEEREPLLRLDSVLDALAAASIDVPTPRTWRLPVDEPLPDDLTFPLFVRTAFSSWKLGGKISRVRSIVALEDEAAALRRAMGWDALVLVRAWHDLAEAGRSVYGPVPQELRVWIVDQKPVAWSFHYLNVVHEPRGFPPSDADLSSISGMATKVGRAFRSRLVVADFARHARGDWIFIEAGPGSCAGTAHEGVFKAVARLLRGERMVVECDRVGGRM